MISAIHKALDAKRARLEEDEKGFTLIELLVVVLIIGILAAIAIPVFLSQQDQARGSAVESDLSSAKVAYVSYMVENDGNGTTTIGDLAAYGYTSSSADVELTIPTGGSDFCIQGTHNDLAGETWSVSAEGGVSDTACGAAATP